MDRASALEEVHELLGPGHIVRVAVDAQGAIVGVIGGQPQSGGHAWELHPLAVLPEVQRQGIGHSEDREACLRAREVSTLYLGTGDENDQTTLSGIDLYPNPLEHLSRIRNLGGHAYEFCQKVGFVIVGVMPNANGWGKPDILMAKRVNQRSQTSPLTCRNCDL